MGNKNALKTLYQSQLQKQALNTRTQEELFAHNLQCGRESLGPFQAWASMQSSTNCNVLTAKGDSCHPWTSWLHTQSPKPSAAGIMELQAATRMGSARAMASEQGRPQSAQPLQWMEQAQTFLSNASFEILCLSPARQPRDIAAALLLQAVWAELPAENRNGDILALYSRYFIIIIVEGK